MYWNNVPNVNCFLEFENQQYVKAIENERQELRTLESQREELEALIRHEETLIPQLDETIKTYHKQFTHNRSNVQK